MAVRRVPHGTGITRKDMLALGGTKEDISDTLQAAAESATFEAQIRDVEAAARDILQAAQYDDKHIRIAEDDRGVLIAEDDTLAHYAQQILKLIKVVRYAIKRRDAEAAARFSMQLGFLVCESDMKTAWEIPALRGKAFIEGPKKPRKDAMDHVIDLALKQHGLNASRNQVIKFLRDTITDKSTIQEIDFDNDEIHWKDRVGRNKMTTFKSLANRLTHRRKTIAK